MPRSCRWNDVKVASTPYKRTPATYHQSRWLARSAGTPRARPGTPELPSAHVREYVKDRLAVLFQFGVANAVDLPQLVQRRRRRGRDEPQGRVVEDHVRRHAQFLGDRRPPGAQPLEHRLGLGRQLRGRGRPPAEPAPPPALPPAPV